MEVHCNPGNVKKAKLDKAQGADQAPKVIVIKKYILWRLPMRLLVPENLPMYIEKSVNRLRLPHCGVKNRYTLPVQPIRKWQRTTSRIL
jgi:hypothetical protein